MSERLASTVPEQAAAPSRATSGSVLRRIFFTGTLLAASISNIFEHAHATDPDPVQTAPVTATVDDEPAIAEAILSEEQLLALIKDKKPMIEIGDAYFWRDEQGREIFVVYMYTPKLDKHDKGGIDEKVAQELLEHFVGQDGERRFVVSQARENVSRRTHYDNQHQHRYEMPTKPVDKKMMADGIPATPQACYLYKISDQDALLKTDFAKVNSPFVAEWRGTIGNRYATMAFTPDLKRGGNDMTIGSHIRMEMKPPQTLVSMETMNEVPPMAAAMNE